MIVTKGILGVLDTKQRNKKIWYICENENEPSTLEGKVAYGPASNEDIDWNKYGPQEYKGWNGYCSQDDIGWIEYIGSTIGSKDILCQGQVHFDTLENVQQLENHYVENSILESDLSQHDDSQT